MLFSMKPPLRLAGSQHSGVCGARLLARAPAFCTHGRQLALKTQSLRQCDLTGKKANNGYTVSFSHIRNKSKQHVNLFNRRVFWPEGKRWVKLKICARALKTIEKKGLQATAKEAGVDLYSLPYEDVSKTRTEWKAKQPKHPPQPTKWIGKSRRMKNPDKLAASKKKPNVARYFMGGRTVISRDPEYVEEYRE